MKSVSPEFEALELANVGEGKLNEQFLEAVGKAYEIFAESSEGNRYELAPGDTLRCNIQMEVSLEFNVESRTLDVGSRVVKFSPPKRKTIFRNGFMRNGVVLVEKLVQADLPMPANVKPISKGGDK